MSGNKNASEIISDFLELIRSAAGGADSAKEMMSLDNDKTNDLHHILELNGLNYKERAKLATEMVKVLKDRRIHKNDYELFTPIAEYFAANKDDIHKIEQLLGKVRKVEEYHKKRFYVPRYYTNVKKEADSGTS